jgi:eukaryotic-like serine/threonine-protein kinase
MSRAFVATERALQRRVVVKLLPPELASAVSAARFRREVQLAARLLHPHIVPVHSAGEAGELLYYRMPLVEGESLRAKLLREGELPVQEAMRILRDVAKALSAAGVESDSLTSAGVALGTPAYMAPEQAAGDPHVDHRADLYALGVIAYEMLTGSHPFAARPAQALLAAHAVETPEPIAKRRPSLPPVLATLVMRLLEKRLADRPQSAQEVLRELE